MHPSLADDLARLYRQLHPELLRFARARSDDDDAAEDFVQQVWTAFAKTTSVEPVRQPRAWLYRALRNAIADAYRTAARRPVLLPLEAVPPARLALAPLRDRDESDAARDGDTSFWRNLDEALAQLPAAQRDVAERHLLDGDTLTDLAAEWHVPVRTIISRKRYAVQRLRALLRDSYDAYLGVD